MGGGRGEGGCRKGRGRVGGGRGEGGRKEGGGGKERECCPVVSQCPRTST